MDANPDWNGPTYYGRPQMKPAPFSATAVGSYVFLAGLSGGAQLLSTLLDLTRGKRAEVAVKRGRRLSLLAPTLGSALLVWDLHTPRRFYNMMRVAKKTSPMSIGTWILLSFSGFGGFTAVADFAADHVPGLGWLRRGVQVAQVPAAAAGAGLGTYTASLLSATSAPLWAAAPRALAVRFAASSVAAGAAALALFLRDRDLRADLNAVCAGALAVELGATVAADEAYRQKGVAAAMEGAGGRLDTIGAFDLGTVLPLGLLAFNMLHGARSRRLSDLASAAVLRGSLLMRIGVIAAGQDSARRPEISMRFTRPE